MAEKNGRAIKTISVIVSICMLVLAIAGLVWAAATQNTTMEHTKTRVEEVRTENIDKNNLQDMQIQVNKEQSIRVEGRLDSIDAGIERIEKKL